MRIELVIKRHEIDFGAHFPPKSTCPLLKVRFASRMVDKPKIDLKRSRLSREMIRRSFLEAAKKRKSLEIEFKNVPKRCLNVVERLQDGSMQLTTVDYEGAIISEKHIPYDHTTLREHSMKPFPKKRMVDARVYLHKTKCVWNTVGDDLNYVGHPKPWHEEYDDYPRIVVEPWELPTDPINVFRLNHDYLMVCFTDADALELTFLSSRKTIRITEVPTESKRGFHSLEEIVQYTLKEATQKYDRALIDQKVMAKMHRGFLRLEKALPIFRANLIDLGD